MNVKLQASGSPFAHTISSCLNIEPKNHIWVNEEDPEAEAIVFMDYDHRGGFDYTGDKKKVLWLCESRNITKPQHADLYNNTEEFLDVYDLVLTHDKELLEKDSRLVYVPNAANLSWVKEPQIYPKSKLVSMISSRKTMCEGHKYRLQWVDRLKNDLDLYGRGFNEIKNKEEGLSDYMFSIVIENGSYNTYFTEKITDCFATGTIPVYYGSPDIGEHFNEDGIVKLTENFDINDLSADLYYEKMDAIKENFDIVQKMQLPEDVIFNLIKERKLV